VTPSSRIGRRFAQLLVHGYQLLLSPFAGGACRFEPSCSAYAAEAIETHGALRGGWLAVRRVARCHPLATPGLDPVPPLAVDRGSDAAVKIRG
jgi:putative membrane protein insertion efficiency factor